MDEKIETRIENKLPKPKSIDWETRLAKARASLRKLEAESGKAARQADTRLKVLAGVGILKAMAADKDLRAIALPAIQNALTESDRAALKELMGEQV